MFRKIVAVLALLITPAAAQNVQQSGAITRQHIPYWVTSGVIADGGSSADSPISSIGVTNNGGAGICVNSGRITGPGYNSLCFGAQTSGPATISLQNFGTATPQLLEFVINGVPSFPVVIPSAVPAGHIAAFGSSNTLQDTGLIGASGAITTGAWQATPVDIPFGGTNATTASGARTNLGLGTMSTQNANAVAITGGTITGLPTPTQPSDAAIKSYVDAFATGIVVKPTSRLATTAVLPNSPTYSNGASGVGATLTAGSNTTLTVDGTLVNLNDVVLVNNQASALQNGIYTLTTAGGGVPWVLTRATYFDQPSEMVVGSYTFISAGATNINTAWVLSATTTSVGVTAVNFNLFSSTSGGVSSVNSQTGAVTIVGGTGISVAAGGGNVTVTNTQTVRTVLNAPTTFHISTAGTNTAGCGLAGGASSCRTRSYLYNIFASSYDFGNQLVTVQIEDGTYTDSLQASGSLLPGQAGGAGLVWSGNCTTPGNVLIQPSNGVGYAYSADGGTSYRIQCQELDQTNQRANLALGADIVSVGHGSKIYFGNPSLVGVRRDVIFGCNFTGYNVITLSFAGQGEWDNDFDVDVQACQVTTTGTPTAGSAVITGVGSTTNLVIDMNIVAAGVPSDAYVLSFVANTSITMACLFTTPCVASSSPGSTTLTMTGGGQSFLDMGNNATANFNTNGEPDASILGNLKGFPFYLSGWFFINEGSTVNAQAITWTNPSQAHGTCSVVKSLSNIDTNLQGIPYLPCKGLTPEVSVSSVALTAGSNAFTVASNAGIVPGQVVADIAAPTATWTAGSPTISVSSNAGICVGSKVNALGILAGAQVTGVSGTTITLAPCGTAGPRCVSNNPTYLSETGVTAIFSNCLIAGNATVGLVSGNTIALQADTALGGGAIKASGTAQNIWFQGRVIRNSVYD